MKKIKYAALTLVMVFMLPVLLQARSVDPIVSTDWLEKNYNNPKVKIIDIRKPEEYKAGHIPNAINVFYNSWAITKKGLQNELPDDDDLVDVIASAGITTDSIAVVVGKTDAVADRVNLTRVAWTLKYAGVEDVAVLDGAYNKWTADKKPVSTDAVKPSASAFKPKWNKHLYASKEYVISKLGKATIVDVRAPEFFFGVVKLDFVARAGRLPGSVNLPAAWLFTADGSFRSKEDLEAMAAGVVGKDTSREVITYCDTGRLCSAGWFVLSEVLGYKNGKAYDGSSEEWAKDPNAPMVKFSWQ